MLETNLTILGRTEPVPPRRAMRRRTDPDNRSFRAARAEYKTVAADHLDIAALLAIGRGVRSPSERCDSLPKLEH